MTALRVVIFAKAPVPGFAKTRLIPALGETGAASLAARMLSHAVEQALAADVGPLELCVTPNRHDAIWHKLALPAGIKLTEQGAGDLGDRMARVTHRAITSGEALLIIGTDCPQLDSDLLQAAAMALQSSDACLVPVSDGGYSLIGLRHFHCSLFHNIPWSSANVAGITRQRMKMLGWAVREFPSLHDIDVPDDLQHIPSTWHSTIGKPDMTLSGERLLSYC